MIDCPCGYGKNIKEDQKNCPICGTDLTPLHRLKSLPQFYYDEGIKLFELGQLDRAIENLMTALSLNSDSASSYLALGNVFVQKGLYNDAILQFEKALEIDPKSEKIKEAKERAEELKKQFEEDQFKQTQKISMLKKLLIGVPVVTFLVGLMVIPLFQGLTGKNIIDYFVNKPSITQLPPLPEKKPKFLYTVRHGDNLTSIAYKFYGDSKMWNNIYEANKNKIISPERLYVGQILSILNRGKQ